MMKHTAILSFICFLLSCHSQSDKSNVADLIKGDWIGPGQSMEFNQTRFICFDDSTCRTSIWKDDIKYEIRKDTLCIDSEDDEKISRLTRYIIVKLTTDSLVLRNYTREQDTLYFSKVNTKNNITPAAIYFASSGCLGRCPSMFLEIDSTRNFRFYGARHTSIKGGFSGRIGQHEYNSIISKIRNLRVDSLQGFYKVSWTDDQTLSMSIIQADTVIHSTAYGHYREPIELHLLYGKLMNLYKNVTLQPDSSVTENYFYSRPELIHDLLPSMPPPLIPLQKFTPPRRINN